MLRRPLHSLLAATLLFASSLAAQTRPTLTPAELRAEHLLQAAKKQGAPQLYAFLKPFPKGGELHMHLSGAIYAETFIADAAHDGLCVAPVNPGTPAVPEGQNALQLVPSAKPPAPGSSSDKPIACASGQVPAADALSRQPLYDALVDSLSMRAYVPSQGINGHDQFFVTFDRFRGLRDHSEEWLDEVATRAAAQNEQYLEIMQTPSFSHAAALGYRLGWPASVDNENYRTVLADLRQQLLAAGLRDEIATDHKQLEDAEAERHRIEHCGEPQGASPACRIVIRTLFQILRGFPPQQVFAQTLLGFEVAQAALDSGHPDVVGLNFVMPEDGRISMADYHLQMLMLDFLHSAYPKVHISLHAGELAPGLVPPAGITFHIREAVELGHAERIGHGVDVLYEDKPSELLKEMEQRHVAVEVNLTSNDVILGIKGSDHPLSAYRAAHVPFALSTDDEGVSRIDLTHEYVRAVTEQNLTYADLKSSARSALAHSFLPGESLFAAPDDYAHRKPACAAVIAAATAPSGPCKALLDSSEKAAQQFELERRFAAFEASIH
ncbi:MAG TPA: hypothetical protein VM865_02535 [Acidobacteriaceae bacterium]|jgi:adenosine deaminase|nr:hypothetical protein [Acidobacteriaceae bacterium]